jgi:hypothetical protein
MRKTSKRGNKKKNKAGGHVSRRDTESRLKSTRRILNSLPLPYDATHMIYDTHRKSKFVDNLKENVTQRKNNKERIIRILYMLEIEENDDDETMRNKVINSNKLVINLLESLRSNLMWRKTMTRGRYMSIFEHVFNINGVLMSMMDPREDRIIENRTFNNLNFDTYRELIHAADTERGGDDALYALHASDVMLLINRIMKFRQVIDTTVATIITSNMPDVLQEIEQNLSPVGGKLYN